MKTTRLISYVFLAVTVLSPAAFADKNVDMTLSSVSNETIDSITSEISAGIQKELSKESVAAAAQDYHVEEVERFQPRRSKLFLKILNSLIEDSTLAKSDNNVGLEAG
ncbi:hypothetical protein EOL70_00280 [Leucothrix sargassi]|nr:hypothetical protein EOL70_00280 [Leucothrix sargassi]